MSKRLMIMQAVVLVALCGVSTRSLSAIEARKGARKNYTKELEEAFVAKLLQDKEEPASLIRPAKDAAGAPGYKEIGAAVVNDIKATLKNPCLDLLASSDLASWDDIKGRVEAVKRATELFEIKYAVELKGTMAAATAAPAVPGVTPAGPTPPAPTAGPEMIMGMPGSTPLPAPAPAPSAAAPVPVTMGIPGPDMGMVMPSAPPPPAPIPAPAVPAPTPAPVVAPAPAPVPTGMPGAEMGMGMPAVTPPPAPAPAPIPAPPGGAMGVIPPPVPVPLVAPAAAAVPAVTPPPIPEPLTAPAATPAAPPAPAPMGGMPMA